jgi:hypothetical protein
VDPKIILWAIGGIFSAGIFYAGVKGMRKDLNGIGRKQREMLAVLIETASKEDREKFIALLKR